MPKNLGAAFRLSHPEAQSLPLMSKITEASVRDDLAAAHRICHKLGLNEGRELSDGKRIDKKCIEVCVVCICS